MSVAIFDDEGGAGLDMLSVTVDSPADHIDQALIPEIQALVDAYPLSPGQGDSLIRVLEAAAVTR